MASDNNKTPRTKIRKPHASTSPKKESRKLRSPTARYTTLAVAAALTIALATAYWGHETWIEKNQASQLKTFSGEHAHTTAVAVGEVLRRYQQQLALAAEKPEVIATLANRNTEAVADIEQQLHRLIPSALSVNALPLAPEGLPSEARSRLRFAERDMIARAEERQSVTPEAAREGDDWLLKFVATVPATAEIPVVGTLLLTLPIDVLISALEQGNQGLGQVELLQSFETSQNILLTSIGQGQAGTAQTADVPNSYWHIRFTPSQQLLEQTHVSLLLPLTLWALLSLLILVAAVALARWLGNRAQGAGDAAQTTSATAAIKAGGGSYTPEDILDIEIRDEDEALLGLEDGRGSDILDAPPKPVGLAAEQINVPEVIFRAYDIRGLAETEITPQLAQQIGQALGSEALDHGQNALVVARDCRTHSTELAKSLILGIQSTGCGVINIGIVPTPLMYFATETLPQTQSGVMVTASHNGAEYNGFKVVITGKSRSADDIQNIRKRILAGNFYSGRGSEEHLDILPQYIDTIFSDVALAGEIHVVVDAGNGVTGEVAPRLFEELGCRVTSLFCELDGTFPNHPPDPSVAAHLQTLVARVKQENADLGVAFDGDGDRLTVVTPKGEIVWADRLLMLYAKDILARSPGADVVFDVKSTRQLATAISNFGGRPIMWKTGHAPMRAKMLETGALVGAEFSGHVFIKDRWYGFDDGIYAAARLIEIISLRGEDLDTMLGEFPSTHITPEVLIPIAEDKKFVIVRQLQEAGDFGDAKLTALDGLRAEFPYGWGLVRASNTSANLTLRFEADTAEDLARIKSLFARELNKLGVRPT